MEPSQQHDALRDATPRETRFVTSTAPTTTAMATTTTTTAAATAAQDADNERQRLQRSLRQSEKRARARRAEKLSHMRQHLEMLSRVQFVLPIVADADAVWDAFLDEELRRTRDRVRCLLPRAKEIQTLLRERAALSQLVRERQLTIRATQAQIDAQTPRALPPSVVNGWQSNVQRWRALARVHFRPWTTQQCQHEIEKATNEMNRFMLSNDKQSTGLSILGWQDSRRIDPNSSRFQFALHKVFRGYDIDQYAATSWRVYTQQDLYSEVIFGGRAKLSLDILQQVTPTMFLIRYVESYDDRPLNIHRVYLVAQVETDDGGVIQYMRSVAMPEVARALRGPDDVWAFDFYWMRWDRLETSTSTTDRASTDFRVSLGGTLYLEDLQYLHYWLFALVGAIVRSEALSTGRQLLEF